MGDPIKTRSNLLADLARAKALFQQRAIMAVLMEGAARPKGCGMTKAGTHRECCESRAADFQSVATTAQSTAWTPAERQTDPCPPMAYPQLVKPMEAV